MICRPNIKRLWQPFIDRWSNLGINETKDLLA